MTSSETTTTAMRNGYPAGVPCWLDQTSADPRGALEFYSSLFGWQTPYTADQQAPGEYYIGALRGGDVAGIGSLPPGMPPMAMWNTYIGVDSADQTVATVLEAGGTLVQDAFDVGTFGRMAVCADPAGAVFCLWQSGEHRGAQVVNEHGSVNFNTLTVPDAGAVAPFYRQVFGWDLLSLGDGGKFWTLPGYGAHLESTVSQGITEMCEKWGVPGFENVVAAISEASDVQPNWSIAFAVDSTDEVVSRTVELGGKVIVPAVDTMWVRTAVVADPQGASFALNQFIPPSE